VNKVGLFILGKTSEFYTAKRLYFMETRGAHNYACTMGGGDSHGANGVVNDDVGAGTFDNNPVAMYLGYYNV
jgi:hypothetical protein